MVDTYWFFLHCVKYWKDKKTNYTLTQTTNRKLKHTNTLKKLVKIKNSGRTW